MARRPLPGHPIRSRWQSPSTSVDGIGDDLDGIGRADPDFYAGASIAGGAQDDGNSFDAREDNLDKLNITPFWTISANALVVDDSLPAVSINLSIWDWDECDDPFCTDTGVFESDDDQLDIKPGAGETATLTLNTNTGRWSGDVNWPSNCITGDGGEAVKVCFDIGIDGLNDDADGDFLLDGWERNGNNADGDGTIDVDLPTMGANPGRKDLFLEIDCIAAANHTHCPVQGGIQAVVQSFANAPVSNVDGSTGIQLHVDIGNLYGHPAMPAAGFATTVLRTGAAPGGLAGNFGNLGGGGNQITETSANLIVDWDGNTGNPATNFYTLKAANFNANRNSAFRYTLFVHQANARAAVNDCTSGWSEGGTSGPGNDSIVSLGGLRAPSSPGGALTACWATDAGGSSVGNQNQQAGTLQHEFGHALGLDHGGNDGVNNKPNYLGVMNYTFQSCSVTAAPPTLPGGCDYSRIDLPDLNEVLPPGLDECAGLGGGLGLGGVDWDGDSTQEGATCAPPTGNVSANVNGDTSNDANGNGSQDPGEPPILSNLTSFDDWNGIRYDFRTNKSFADGGVPSFPDEATPEMIAAAQAYLADLVQPILTVDKTGPANATPGDTLSYDIKVSNTGHGPALSVGLTDTKPDASQATFDLGTLAWTAETTRSTTYLVPCATADQTVLTNSATAAGVDMLGGAVSAPTRSRRPSTPRS